MLLHLEVWRSEMAKNTKAIFLTVKETQAIFNGYGAQETSDMLFQALIHPATPTNVVCKNDSMWNDFKRAVVGYQAGQMDLIKNLSNLGMSRVSKKEPFPFSHRPHAHFLQYVSTYRRDSVKVSSEVLDEMHKRKLLSPMAQLQENGHGQGKSNFSSFHRVYSQCSWQSLMIFRSPYSR